MSPIFKVNILDMEFSPTIQTARAKKTNLCR